MYVCMYVRMYVRMYLCMYVCMYIYIYTRVFKSYKTVFNPYIFFQKMVRYGLGCFFFNPSFEE